MKRQFFLLCLTAGIIGISGCRNDALEEAVSFSIGEPTRTEFTFQAGLGSVSLQVSGSVSVTAESSAPEWCRVAVYDNSTVVYNVDTNLSEEQRSATVTISADGFPSESFDIIQGPLAGLVVTPTELTFSDEETEISIEVIAACEYDIVEVENPDNTFSWEKSQDGSVITFSSPLPGVYAQEGQVNLVPKLAEGETLDGDGIVPVTLTLPRMGTYKLLLGEWNVDRFASDDLTSVTFEEDVYGETYKVYLNGIENIETLPLTVEYVADEKEYENGRVFIRTAQKLGQIDSYYYNMHFNGTQNGGPTVIFSSERDDIAWAAEPVLDDETRTVSLSFKDSGLGRGSIAVTFALWRGPSGYFDFKENIVMTDYFDISKGYPDTDPGTGGDIGEDGGETGSGADEGESGGTDVTDN